MKLRNSEALSIYDTPLHACASEVVYQHCSLGSLIGYLAATSNRITATALHIAKECRDSSSAHIASALMPLWYYCISRLLAGMGYLRDIILRAALRHTCTAAEHTSSAHTAYPATPDNLTAHKKRSNSSPNTCELRGLLHLGLEWTTGMSFDFKFNHNPNQDVGWCLHPTQYTQTSKCVTGAWYTI